MAATPSTREYQVYGRARPRPRSRLRAWAVAAGVVLLAALAIGANAVLVRGEVVRGVSVAGVDVAGSDVRAATATLNEQLAPRLDVPVTVRAGRLRAEVVPSRLGIRLEAGASARRALEMGRVRGSLFPFGYEADVQPVLKLPLDFAAPASLAARTDPPVDARLRLRPDGSSTVVPGRAGIGFEPRGALRAIGLAALAGEAEVQLRQQHLEPRITTADAERAKARVGVILGAPIVLERGDESSGALPRRTVARLLTTRSGRTGIGVVFAPERVREALEPLLRPYLRKPRNATWRTDGERAVVLSSVRGLRLNAKLTAQRLTAASLATEPGKRRARIAFAVSLPAFTTKEARALGITHLVSSFTTDMGVSSPNRIHNVHLMADLLQDQIVGPGETFSFNQAVGPRTAERGFLEGQAIENGLLVPSIGGGVCQVATTVFNAAFEGGYPVGARLNHSFYISHYPMGRDATVADGGPDFSFTNDTRHALLVKTSYTDSTLTVSFYSRPVRRTVTATTSEQY